MANKLLITETILRDAHQSQAATRMRTDEMLPACEILDKIGYYSLSAGAARLSTPACAFLNEDPWEACASCARACPTPSCRCCSAARTYRVTSTMPTTWLTSFVKKSIENGIDIIRIFDALNDPRNLKQAIDSTKKYGGTCEVAMSYTVSPVHTEDYFVNLAVELQKMGADVICIKDMANLLLPCQRLHSGKAPEEGNNVPIHLHTHNTAGTGDMTPAQGYRGGC